MALFLLGSGLFLLFATGYILFQSHLLRQNIERQGTVIDLKVDDEGAAAPVVRFIDHNGREVTITSLVSAMPPAYTIGQSVTVVYPPNQPGQARIKGESKQFLAIFGALSVALIVVGVIAMLMGW
ncbi:DUF3592 domain-containing protein [Chloroflexus sp.]|uniref:DUF3592 domain-containing protein n=1 Tax=Chloroflexus sp. TaxID=1904827 RepID=UPI00298F34C1|nr:DUF3592 domain-containing protein [Chloroflexus sp.]MDW8403255.1 DUF3592 domain-containing protein [Chloroflexus sp.]